MMWNFLVSALTVGCTCILYDGSPLYDPAYLWRLVDDLGITIFGTSAKYIDQLAVSSNCPPSSHESGVPQTLTHTSFPPTPHSYRALPAESS